MPQWDLANSDCIVVMGSNMAENHPISFRFALQAKAKGATLIHVDPRFTRTSALADIYAPVRAGSDIAFLGGIIRHVLENDLWFKEYALHYGRRIYQIGMPWHFGWIGYATGDIANVLTSVVGDPNTSMHENKALTCSLRRGRLSRAPRSAA